MFKPTLFSLALCVYSSGAWAAQPHNGECFFAYSAQGGMPAFKAYPPKRLFDRPKPPRTRTGEARRFRTAIRTGVVAGVNFGGRYTIVGWGCGSSCLDWALVDRQTGSVYFDPQYRIVSTVYVDLEQAPHAPGVNDIFNGLRFRQDSTLLIVQGAPREDEARDGLTFLQWSGRTFRKVAFVPATELCRQP